MNAAHAPGIAAFLVTVAVAQGPPPVFVEVAAAKATVHEQEPLRVRITFGHDREFFAARGVPLFQRSFDLPFQVQAPWVRELDGTGALPLPEPPADRSATCVVNEAPARAVRLADRTIDGRPFAVHAIEHELLPLRPGPLRLAAPALAYAFAERFEQDFLGSRTPVDRQVAEVRGNELALTVLPLPLPRPAGFSGAVGKLAIRAEAEPHDLAVGAPLRFSLHIEGHGNLSDLVPPPLPPLAGLQVRGVLAANAPGSATFTWELAPRSAAVTAIPPVPFCYFETTDPPGYRTLRTAPIPITVRSDGAAGGPADLGDAFGVPGETDIHGLRDSATVAPAVHPSLPRLALVLLAPWLLAFGLHRLVAARERDRRDPAGVRARQAAGRFTVLAAAGGEAAAFPEYLAARLRCSQAAVVAPDLAARLRAAGAPADLAAAAHALVRELVGARYGGPPVDARAAAPALVARLEAAFRRQAKAPFRAPLLASMLVLGAVLGDALRAQDRDAAAAGALAYRQGDFTVAAEQFELALASATDDAQRGTLLVDLGNCAFRRGDPAAAVWHWQRALRRLPGDAKLRWNLAFATAQLGLAPEPAVSLHREVAAWIGACSPAELLGWCALLQTSGLLAFVLARRRSVRAAAALAVLAGLLAAGRYLQIHAPREPDTGVVLAAATLRATPAADGVALAEVAAGALVALHGRRDGWIEVEHEGSTGFTPAAAIGVVD